MLKKPIAIRRSKQTCPDGKYWVSPHLRKKIDKNGKSYVEHVKGYCSSYHGPFPKIAEEEKIPFDHLFFCINYLW